jgi:hypothetical protein
MCDTSGIVAPAVLPRPRRARRRAWISGVGEIRTHEGLSPLAVFKTAAFNRSATTPQGPNFLAG